jgi:hypothetical protein
MRSAGMRCPKGTFAPKMTVGPAKAGLAQPAAMNVNTMIFLSRIIRFP